MKKGKHYGYNEYKRKNLFHRAAPWLIVLGCLAAACALSYGIVRFIRTRPEPVEEAVFEAAGDSSLPTLTMEFNGRMVNELYAYSSEMDLNYAAQTVYLLEEGYEIPIEIDLNGKAPAQITFFLYDIENSSLIQNGTSGDFTYENGSLGMTLVLDQVISNDTEYVLDIVLDLKSGEELHYYTRVLKSSGTYTADEMETALSFVQATIDGDEDGFSSYMETNPWTQSNNNFSGVNLKSSIKQMMWQDMEVSLYGDISVTILDINDTIACFELEYILTREDGDITEYYRVSDYLRIRMSDQATYILSYERSVDQVFVPSDETLSTSSAQLGIISSDDLETAASSDGYYSCFVYAGTLWQADSSSKSVIRIFSFESDDAADTDFLYYDHDIDILSVSTDGDVEFLVYGYMNAGLHEGLCGIGLYSYSASEGEVTEKLFIQADVPYEILKETTGNMIYVTEDETLYVLIDQTLYSISLEDYGMDIVAEGLSDGSYMVSIDCGIIAWQEDGKINDASQITVFDAESAQTRTITAPDGYCVKILGFVGDDLVYGTGTAGNYYYDDTDEEFLLLDTAYVIGFDGTQAEGYEADSGYFISAEYEYNRIIIETDEGESLTVYSSEISAVESPGVSSTYDDIKEYIYYVSFIESTTTAGDFTIETDIPLYLSDSCVVSPSNFLDLSGRYLVYGKGELVLITSSASEAISAAYDYEGYVKTESGYFYRRGMRASSISLSESSMESAIEKYKSQGGITVTGITLAQAYYFTGESIALIWVYEGETYLIYGYDYSDDLLLYNIETGQESEMSDTTAEEAFENSEGSLYVVN